MFGLFQHVGGGVGQDEIGLGEVGQRQFCEVAGAAAGIQPAQTISRNARVYFPFLMRNVGANMVWFILPLFLVSLGANDSWVAI